MKGWFCYLKGTTPAFSCGRLLNAAAVFHQLYAPSYHSVFLNIAAAHFFVLNKENMRVLLIGLLLPLFFENAAGQITGKLIATDSTPLAFASISLLKLADSSFVKGSISNETGVFHIDNILGGKYILRISGTGFSVWYPGTLDFLEDVPKAKNIGILVINEERKQLDEVVVKAKKDLFQQRPEGMIINVENSLLTKGSSALQLLERSPGVTINYRDNSIALNGKNGVMVMLNGKLMRMPMEQLVAMLNNMSADDIASIELLTMPPAKYDAEGSAGLINIVLKKNKKPGNNGSISFTAGYGKAEKGTGSISLSRNTRQINLYGAYSFSHNKTYTDMYVASSQHMPFLGGDVSVTGWFNSMLKSNTHDANIGMDTKLNAHTSIGGNISYNNSRMSGAAFTNAGYNVLPDSLLQFSSTNRGGDSWNNLVNTVYLEKTMKEGEKINISADWLCFNNKDGYEVQSSFTNKHGMQAGDNQVLFSPAQQGSANTTIKVGVAKIDYTKQFTAKLALETGLKAAYTQSTSLSGIQSLLNGIWTGSDETSNHILMRETIGAAYASLNAHPNPSIHLSAGIRYEYSYTNMDNSKTGAGIVHRKLSSFFPSVFFSKKIADNSELQLSYTKRISRPSYKDLASYVGYSDPTAVYTGNPFLQPTITNNIKLGYNYKNYSFSLLFSRDDNAIARYQLTESPARDILYISPQNLDWQNNITLQTSLPFSINSWWSMNYSFAGGLRQYKVGYTKNAFEKNWFGYSFNFSQAFKLPKNFSAEISGWYNNATYNGTQMVEGFGILNAGIKKELKKNGGSFQLTVSDILMDQKYKVHYGTLTEEAFSIKSYVSVNTESTMFPIIKLTYSRSFGSGIKDQRKQSTVSNDERDRMNN